jgi:hypothetical protein
MINNTLESLHNREERGKIWEQSPISNQGQGKMIEYASLSQQPRILKSLTGMKLNYSLPRGAVLTLLPPRLQLITGDLLAQRVNTDFEVLGFVARRIFGISVVVAKINHAVLIVIQDDHNQ